MKILYAISGILFAGILCAVLFVNNVYFVWILVAIAMTLAASRVWKFGIRWKNGLDNKVARQERFLLLLVSLMVFFLTTGTALYLCAFSYEATDSQPSGDCCGNGEFAFINAEYLFRSLACSFLLFTGNIDSNVLDGIREHSCLKGLISLQAFLSFLCTAAVLLSLVYARFFAYYKLHARTKMDVLHNHLYVFFELNESSRQLAKSIKEREPEQSVVIFVENSQVDDSDRSGWNNIIGMFTHRRQTFADIADIKNARVAFSETRLCDIDRSLFKGVAEADILKAVNLLKLRDLISQLNNIDEAQLHVFFLSDNVDENIRTLAILALDQTIHQIKDSVHFYCHARQNSLNRVIEDIAVKQSLDVHIVDSSHLAVELLKAEPCNHPVQLMDIDRDNPTTVSSRFTSLIVGFDEVGRDALKFLYEFGAFVDSSAGPEQDRRSPFHCVAVDKNMADREGPFTAFAPAVMQQTNPDGSRLVELIQCNCQSREFYSDVMTPGFCEELNYIIIAVGDDELGMMLAIRLLTHIRRIREDLRKLRIYVRSYHADKETYMQQIANYYNDGYRKDCVNKGKMEYKTDAIIIPFGQKEKIYSYDMIINEELTRKGRIYQESYARLSGEKTPLWNERRKKAQENPSLDTLRKVRRQEQQDLGNALHADSKLYLLKQCMPDDYDWQAFFNACFDETGRSRREGHYTQIKYSGMNPFENQVMLNLARLEHIRWNASHEILGYVRAHEGLHGCDERTREHNCLLPWQDLDAESKAASSPDWECDYKVYDYIVVENSIFLNKDKLMG